MGAEHDRGRPCQDAPVVTESANSKYDRRPLVMPEPRPWADDHGRRHRWAVAQRLEPLHDGRRDPNQHQHHRFVVPSCCPYPMTAAEIETERAKLLARGIPFPETVVMIGPAVAA